MDELLEMNMSLEADVRHSDSVPPMVHRFLQSELDFDQELSELIGQSTCLSVPCHLRHFT